MPQISQRNRPRDRAWSPGAAGPILVTPVNTDPGLIRQRIRRALDRQASTVARIAATMGVARSEIISVGRDRGLVLDFTTDLMVTPDATTPDTIPASDPDRPWWDDANCSADPDSFYPEENGIYRHLDVAKAICAGCPVRPECLEYALDNREAHGVWGGLSEYERQPLQRSRRRAA